MRIVITYRMTPIGVKLNLKSFILISYAVSELLRKVSQGGIRPPPPGETGLSRYCIQTDFDILILLFVFDEINLIWMGEGRGKMVI